MTQKDRDLLASCYRSCLELDVGYNTPGIIKYPFWQMTAENPQATYACVNNKETACPREIAERSICIKGDIGAVIGALPGKSDCSDKW